MDRNNELQEIFTGGKADKPVFKFLARKYLSQMSCEDLEVVVEIATNVVQLVNVVNEFHTESLHIVEIEQKAKFKGAMVLYEEVSRDIVGLKVVSKYNFADTVYKTLMFYKKIDMYCIVNNTNVIMPVCDSNVKINIREEAMVDDKKIKTGFKRMKFFNLPEKEDSKNKKYRINYNQSIDFETLGLKERNEFTEFCRMKLNHYDNSSRFQKIMKKVQKFVSCNSKSCTTKEQKFIDQNIYKIGRVILKRCKEEQSLFRKSSALRFDIFIPIIMQELGFKNSSSFQKFMKNVNYEWINENNRTDIKKEWLKIKKWLKTELYKFLTLYKNEALSKIQNNVNCCSEIENNEDNRIKTFFGKIISEDFMNNEGVEVQNQLNDRELLYFFKTSENSDFFVEFLTLSNVSAIDLANIYMGYLNNVLKGIFPKHVSKLAEMLGNNKKNETSEKIDWIMNRYLFFSLEEEEKKFLLFTFSIWKYLEENQETTHMNVYGCIVCLAPCLIDVDITKDLRMTILGSVQILERLVSFINFEKIDSDTYAKFLKYKLKNKININ